MIINCMACQNNSSTCCQHSRSKIEREYVLIQVCEQRLMLIAYYHFGYQEYFAFRSFWFYLPIYANFYSFHNSSFFKLYIVYGSLSGWQIENQYFTIFRIPNFHWLISCIFKFKFILQFHFPQPIHFRRFFYKARSDYWFSFKLLWRAIQNYILVDGQMAHIFNIVYMEFLAISQCFKKVPIKFLFAAKIERSCPYHSSAQHYYSAYHSYNLCKDLQYEINIKQKWKLSQKEKYYKFQRCWNQNLSESKIQSTQNWGNTKRVKYCSFLFLSFDQIIA